MKISGRKRLKGMISEVVFDKVTAHVAINN